MTERAESFFAEAERLPIVDLESLARGGGLVVVAPHPDDESLGCGGLMAAAGAAGIDVRLVVVSDGAKSHPNSRRYPAEALRSLREEETKNALRALGLSPDRARFLRLPDTAVPVEGAAADSVCAVVSEAIDACRAGTVCVTWPFDPHCDHRAAADLVARAVAPRRDVRILHYPVWGWTLPSDAVLPGPPVGFRFDVRRHAGQKAAAIAAHRSQTTRLIDDDPHGFMLQPEMLAHFVGPFETFFLAASAAA